MSSKKPPAVSMQSLNRRVAAVEVEVAEVKQEQQQLSRNMTDVMREQAVATVKLDTLISMSEEHSELTKARLDARTRIVTALFAMIGVVAGAIAAVAAGGCT